MTTPRGYLAHFDGETTQSVNFRLSGAIPQALRMKWRRELEARLDIPELDIDVHMIKKNRGPS